MFLFAALSLATIAHPSNMRVFGHWAVSCDGDRRCVAMEMKEPGRRGAMTGASMRVTRNAVGATVVEIWPGRPVHRAITIRAGDKMIYRGRVHGDVVRLIGKRGERFLRAVLTASDGDFVIRAHGGDLVGSVPLHGIGHSIRYMDEQQGGGAYA